MRYYSRALLSVLFIGSSVVASFAQKKQYTMAEATNGIATTLAPKSVKGASWRPGTHELYGKMESKFTRRLFTDAPGAAAIDPTKTDSMNWRDNNTWISQSAFYQQKGDTLILSKWEKIVDPATLARTEHYLPKGNANLEFCPATGDYAFTVDNNLYFSHGNVQPVAITLDADKNIVNGQAVHRNEFGIDKGIFFSPKGNFLAYYRMDQTMVADYPVIDWSVTPARNENIKYPMAGDTSHQVTLRVYNVTTGKMVIIKTDGPKDQYLTCVTWSPDEKHLYIAVLNRDQNHLWLNQYDATTGNLVRTILEEKDDKYVEPQHELSFLPGSNTEAIWWSQRDGYMHLWLCDLKSGSLRCLTPGSYVVNDLLGFNAARKEILITSAKEDPREKHGYAVNWKTGKMRRLDTEPGTHNYVVSDDGAYAFDVYTGVGVAKRSIIRATDGTFTKVLLDAPNTLAAYERPQIIDKEIKAADGTPLYGKLILPANFDSTKKYPVIVYLYNGPHVQLIKKGFPESGNLWYEYLAQHGYIVWTMDGRGSANRGMNFEQAVFRRLGTIEMEDQLRGVEFLKSLAYVDGSRMGVHGWSFGGFMTTSLMLRHPGVFKVGVGGGPVMDWKMYEIMYGERYMDRPDQNPGGYKESALFDKVKNLKGKLLLIHGAQDATVVWQHSIKFLKACVDENVQVDYFIYPGYEHNVRGKDRVHLMQKVTDYFDQHL